MVLGLVYIYIYILYFRVHVGTNLNKRAEMLKNFFVVSYRHEEA